MENWAVFLVVLSFGIACYYELNLIRHSLNEHSLSLEGLRRALERIEAHVGSLPNPFAAAETEQ